MFRNLFNRDGTNTTLSNAASQGSGTTLKDLLNYQDIPGADVLLESEAEFLEAVKLMYGTKDVALVPDSLWHEYYIHRDSKIWSKCFHGDLLFSRDVIITGERKTVMVKEGWEGAQYQALGHELYNMLTEHHAEYCFGLTPSKFHRQPSDGTLMFEAWNGIDMENSSWIPDCADINDYAYAFGRWKAIADELKLGDRMLGGLSNPQNFYRPPRNLFYDPEKNAVLDIDYGFLFGSGGFTEDMPRELMPYQTQVNQGYQESMQRIKTAVQENIGRLSELSTALQEGIHNGSVFYRNSRSRQYQFEAIDELIAKFR